MVMSLDDIKRLEQLDKAYNAVGGNAALEKSFLNAAEQIRGKYPNQTQLPPPVASQINNNFLNDQRNMLQELYSNRQSAELSRLKQAKETALQGLNQTRSLANQQAYQSANQADAVNAQNAKRLREIMASSGLSQGGENISAMASLGAERQNVLGAINQNRDNILSDVSEREGLIKNQASEQEMALIQQLNAEKMKDLLELERYGDQRNLAIDDRDYARDRDTIMDKRYDNQFLYQQQRDSASDNRYVKEFENMLKQQELDNAYRQTAFDWSKSSENPAVQAQQIQNDIAKLELQSLPELQRLQLQQLKKQIAQIGARPARTAQQVEMDNIALQKAKIELEKLQNPQKTQGMTDAELKQYAAQLATSSGYFDQDSANQIYNYLRTPSNVKMPSTWEMMMNLGGKTNNNDLSKYFK